MPAKKNFPPSTHKRITRPDKEQLAILEKAIYHSYQMSFISDPGGTSNILFEGKPVKTRSGDQVKLDKFFKLIVKTYSTL